MNYTVRRGDTLGKLAKEYGTTVKALAEANGIKDVNLIRVGQELVIPGQEASADSSSQPGSGKSEAGSGPVVAAAAEAQGSAGELDVQRLRTIMPRLAEARARELLPYLSAAMKEASIDTPLRQAAFLAQLGHESGDLRYFEELASGAAYEGRKDLGNTEPGDGTRYKGRGPIQLTGRANYRAAGKALGLDLENEPTRAADLDVAFRTAAWFWNSRKLNTYADAREFDTITRRINGGYNGKADRDARYARALEALGVGSAEKKPETRPAVASAPEAAPRWMEIALAEQGQAEVSTAGQHNPRIVEYHSATTLKASDDETPWCSSFVNWVMSQSGHDGTRNALASSWLSWGQELNEPRYGAITVIRSKSARGNVATGSTTGYHVGFLVERTEKGVRLLGGNQSDSVKVSTFSLERYTLEGYRWPA